MSLNFSLRTVITAVKNLNISNIKCTTNKKISRKQTRAVATHSGLTVLQFELLEYMFYRFPCFFSRAVAVFQVWML